jgi:MFS family permease
MLAGISQFIGTMGPLLAGGPFILLVTNLGGNWRFAITLIGLFGIVLAFLSLIFVKNKSRDNEQSFIVLKREEALLDILKRLLRNKQAWYIALYSASMYLPMALLGALWGTNYLQIRGLTQNIAADIISIGWLGYAIGCPVLGALSDFTRRRKFALILPAAVTLIATLLITYLTTNLGGWSYSILFFILGLASGGQSVGFAIIAEHVALKVRATALGLNNSMMLLFSTVFPLLTGYFIHQSATANHNPSLLQTHNFFLGFAIMPILGLFALLLAIFFIEETYCRPQKTTVVLDTKSSVENK